MAVLFILLFSLVNVSAFAPVGSRFGRSAFLNMQATPEPEDNFGAKAFDFLSGKAAVRAEMSGPKQFTVQKLEKVKKMPKMSEAGKACVESFVAENSQRGIPVEVAAKRFLELVRMFGGDAEAEKEVITMIGKNPIPLYFNSEKTIELMDIYVDIWGLEKAKGVVGRNPALFAVPADGYGSAKGSGDETVFMSYFVDFTRPIGKYLLAGLALALLKPFIVSLASGSGL
jgi:hypothetical protein